MNNLTQITQKIVPIVLDSIPQEQPKIEQVLVCWNCANCFCTIKYKNMKNIVETWIGTNKVGIKIVCTKCSKQYKTIDELINE